MQILHSQTDHELGTVRKDPWVGNQSGVLPWISSRLLYQSAVWSR